MTAAEILEKISARGAVGESREYGGVLNAWVEPRQLAGVITCLKNEHGFDHLNFITAVDGPATNSIDVVYRLYANAAGASVVVRVRLDRAAPAVASIAGIFRGAEWHEREVFEMFGVNFANHPDLRKLLLTEDIVNPLRKDFTHPDHNPRGAA